MGAMGRAVRTAIEYVMLYIRPARTGWGQYSMDMPREPCAEGTRSLMRTWHANVPGDIGQSRLHRRETGSTNTLGVHGRSTDHIVRVYMEDIAYY